MKGAPRLVRSVAGEGLGSQKTIRLYDKQAAAFDASEPLHSSCLGDAPESEDSVEAGPFVFFILSANETTKVEAPGGYGGAAEIESAEGDGERRGPAIGGDLCSGSPEAIPTWIDDGIACEGGLLFYDAAVTLSAEGIDLENVGVAMAERGVNGNGEIVVEILGKISTELCGDDGVWGGVETTYADVEMAGVVEDTDFGVLGCGLSFQGLALAEIGDDWPVRPERVFKRAIQAGRMIDAERGGSSLSGRWRGLGGDG